MDIAGKMVYKLRFVLGKGNLSPVRDDNEKRINIYDFKQREHFLYKHIDLQHQKN